MLILDLMMPRVSGFEVIEKGQSDSALDDMRIIVVTAMHLNAEQIKELHKFELSTLKSKL